MLRSAFSRSIFVLSGRLFLPGRRVRVQTYQHQSLLQLSAYYCSGPDLTRCIPTRCTLGLMTGFGEFPQGVVRAVCAIIDAFHFLPPADAEAEDVGAADSAKADAPATADPAAAVAPAAAAAEEMSSPLTRAAQRAAAAASQAPDGASPTTAAARWDAQLDPDGEAGSEAEEAEGAIDDVADAAEADKAAAQAADIRAALLRRVLPALSAQLRRERRCESMSSMHCSVESRKASGSPLCGAHRQSIIAVATSARNCMTECLCVVQSLMPPYNPSWHKNC